MNKIKTQYATQKPKAKKLTIQERAYYTLRSRLFGWQKKRRIRS
jgi:hypothetical protein